MLEFLDQVPGWVWFLAGGVTVGLMRDTVAAGGRRLWRVVRPPKPVVWFESVGTYRDKKTWEPLKGVMPFLRVAVVSSEPAYIRQVVLVAGDGAQLRGRDMGMGRLAYGDVKPGRPVWARWCLVETREHGAAHRGLKAVAWLDAASEIGGQVKLPTDEIRTMSSGQTEVEAAAADN